jgi:signal recognition particle GTPase
MLDNLRTGLRSALKKIVGASDINEEIIDSLCKDVQRALLQSDVNVRLVLSITDNLWTVCLKPKDRLYWQWEVMDGKMIAVVMKYEGRPKQVLKHGHS